MNSNCLLLVVLCAVLTLGFADAKARGANRKIERKVYRGQTNRLLQMEGMGMGSVEDMSEDEGMGSGVMVSSLHDVVVRGYTRKDSQIGLLDSLVF